jgi:hypothetical protein
VGGGLSASADGEEGEGEQPRGGRAGDSHGRRSIAHEAGRTRKFHEGGAAGGLTWP